jgi:hypothetical protein
MLREKVAERVELVDPVTRAVPRRSTAPSGSGIGGDLP